MQPNQPEGFRFRTRHLIILVVFFSVFLGILTPISRELGARGLVNPPLFLLVAAPWLLGTLILVFERRSPVKFWAAPLMLSLMAPALAICHNWLVVESWLRVRTIPNLLMTFSVNISLIGAFTFYITHMCPKRCPECRSLTLIPLRGFFGPAARTIKTRWCAACGAKYWRTSEGEWRIERRRTWFDLPEEPATADAQQRRFDVDSRVLSTRLPSKFKNAPPLTAPAGPAADSTTTSCGA